jgi:hypothetical protein
MYSPEDTMRGVDSVLAQMLGEEQNNRRTASSGIAMA